MGDKEQNLRRLNLSYPEKGRTIVKFYFPEVGRGHYQVAMIVGVDNIK